MRSTPNTVIARLGLLLVSAFGVWGCALGPLQSQNETQRYPSVGLETTQPVDIAVVPVVDETRAGLVPVRTLRDIIYLGLADKLYSPVSLNYVDVNWVEAGFDSGSLGADGILKIVIEEWDASILATHGAIRMELTVEILDGARPGASPLWGARLKRRLEVADGAVTLPRDQLYEKAARMAAAEVLAVIPERSSGIQ